MSDLRRATLRFGVAAGAVLLAVLEVQNLLGAALAAGRTRARHLRLVEQSLVPASPHVQAALLQDSGPPWTAARAECRRFWPGGVVEILLAPSPGPGPAPRPSLPLEGAAWPRPGSRPVIRAVLTGSSPRLEAWAGFESASGQDLVLRLQLPTADLVAELEEQRELLLTHAAALLTLVLGAGLALAPRRTSGPSDPGDAVYGEAIRRLRQQGYAMAEAHEADRLRSEQRLRETEAFARAGELTAGIAHEVRNGLATIVGFARLAERTDSLDEARAMAGRARQECDGMERVVRRFLELVRAEKMVLEPLDVGELLERLKQREAARPALPELVVRCPAGLTVEADDALLERAVENLIRNAMEAAHRRVTVEARSEDAWVVITIEDDGSGMSPETRRNPRPFATSKPKGLGLGLPLVAKLVALHGGDLCLEPAHPHGLRATIRLPAARVAARLSGE